MDTLLAARLREPSSGFRWPRRLAALLGRLPDALLGRLAKVSYQAVAAERRRRDIPPFAKRRRPIEWTPEMIALLGTDSDRRVAVSLHVNHSSVFMKRRSLGIAPYVEPVSRHGRFPWTKQALALLGNASDRDVARRLGLTAASVYTKRRCLGIPSYMPARRRVRWSPEMIGLLGKVPDIEVARRFGMTDGSVERKRVELGITPCPHPRPIARTPAMKALLALPNREALPAAGISESAARKLRREFDIPTPDGRNWRWSEEALARLGKDPDAVIARAIGLTRPAVTYKRLSLGIRARHPKHRWTKAECALLGKLPDPRVAARLRLSLEAVEMKRRLMGIGSIRRK